MRQKRFGRRGCRGDKLLHFTARTGASAFAQLLAMLDYTVAVPSDVQLEILTWYP